MDYDGQAFRLLADSSSNGWLVHDAKTKDILWANQTACYHFGFSVDELRALKAHHMSSQDPRYRRSMGTAWLQSAVVNGRTNRLWKYASRGGGEFMTDATATLVTVPDSEVVGGTVDVIFVEFRVLNESSVAPVTGKWIEDSMERLMLHTSSGMMLLDSDYRVIDVSAFAATLIGSSVPEMIGARLDELVELDTPLGNIAVLAEMSKPDGGFTLRLQTHGGSGEVRWMAGMLDNIVVDGERIRVLTVRDISTKVEWEQRNEYQEKNLQYMSRNNAMGDMAMILAHDLGQPIAAATNYLGGVRRRMAASSPEGCAPGVLYGLDQASAQLDRVADIVSSVKKYVARIESVTTSIDLNDTLEECLYFIRLRGEDKGVTVKSSLGSGKLMMTGESILIGQVIINICVNAIDEASTLKPGDRTIEVGTERVGDTAAVVVKDRGRGITTVPAELLAAGAFTTKRDGAGIGLVISEHIVQRHGGNITYEPGEPQGTLVRISFPLDDTGSSAESSA
jgi:two-component system sensor kinase FixL